MKTIYSIVITCVLVICFALQPARAQKGFDVKKKKNIPVNTSSLQAVQINGATVKNSSTRSSAHTFQKQLTFNPTRVQQQGNSITYSTETALPSFIITSRSNTSVRAAGRSDAKIASFNYLNELKSVLNVEKPEEDFVVQHITTDNGNRTHVRLNQQYRGVPVYGAEVIVHLNEFGEGESFNGNYYSINDNINTVPALSQALAIEKMNSHLSSRESLRKLTSIEKQLVQFEKPEATLCIYQDKGLVKTFVLAYHIVASPSINQRWEYFVDASTGAVLHRFETTCFVDGPKTATANDLNTVSRTINTYQKGTTFYMLDVSRPMFKAASSVLPDEPVGGILILDMNNTFGDNPTVQHVTSTNNTWTTANQIKAVSAQFNGGLAYEYYRTNHNRNSIDGNGGTIISIINVSDPKTGQALDNAFWNGKAMFYGNGNTEFKPLAGGLDVAGHEMTHGVVENTANLEYQGESGAINESMADIFGSMMDPTDWLIGEDVVKLAAFPSGALRSMSDPHNGGTSLSSPGFQPKHVNEKYTGNEDNGGVHVNSGITNHAFFKYAEAITRDKAADVFYKALSDYLTKSSQFIDLRLAVIKAAGDLFGTTSNEVTQAGIAFDAVGITNGQGGDYSETLPGNPGSEFLLVYNTDSGDANTLYRSTLDGATVSALSTTDFISRPSITDDGTIAVFVGDDNKIHALNTAPGDIANEVIIQNDAIWANVVISKGGTKLAAVTNGQDGMIHVYDFGSSSWGDFELYNPTYTEGVISAGPVYADALEWDYNGEYLVYDCFNSLHNNDGTDIEYWDVSFIHVWDNVTGDFSDGTIAKLFSSLPDGVSIGNPSFAKNSPGIIAFDYVDTSTGEYAVLGCNVETNDVNVITSNTTLGWPSFNKNDSRVAYTALDGANSQTWYVALNSDKISASATPVLLFDFAKWPVYFATGDRVIGDVTGVEEESIAKVSMSCYPNPFVDEVLVKMNEDFRMGGRIEVMTLLGQTLYQTTVPPSGKKEITLKLGNLPPGQFVLRYSSASKTVSSKIVKLE